MAKKPPFVRSAYNYDVDEASKETATFPFGEDRTVQSDKDDADINTIVRRFGIGGVVPQNVKAPMVGDFCSFTDFQSAVNAVVAAEDSFMKMPAELRQRLRHDPNEFVKWCSDDKNRDELKKYGLLRPGDPPVVVPPVVPVSPPVEPVASDKK